MKYKEELQLLHEKAIKIAEKQRKIDKDKRLVKVGYNTWKLVSQDKYNEIKKINHVRNSQ